VESRARRLPPARSGERPVTPESGPGRADAGSVDRVRPHDQAPPERKPLLDEAVEATKALASSRSRRGLRRAPVRYLASGVVTGGSFLVALLCWIIIEPPSPDAVRVLALCMLVHSVAALVEFEIGHGVAVPTTPVLLVACFLLPPPLVPVVAFAGQQLASALTRARRPEDAEDPLAVVGSSWHAFGPALVFQFFPVGSADLGDWPVVVAALAAQMVFDGGVAWLRSCYGQSVPSRQLLDALRFTFLIDALLAPIGFAAALARPGSPLALLFFIPLMFLLGLLQRDRRNHIDRMVVLAEAYGETHERARRDPLTGLRNRLAWEEALAAWAGSRDPVGVVLADADGLKKANDTFGHEMGDRLLAAIGGEMAKVAPAAEGIVVARLGGDEFGILLPGTHAASADRVGLRLRAAFRAAAPLDGHVPVSASVGMGLASDGAKLQGAIEEADRGVYEDKTSRKVQRR